jgi:hypothetical protein
VHGTPQAGVSGFSLSHSDVGGYTAIPTRVRSKQLLLRWMELSALADAVFRTHQGNKPFSNAQVRVACGGGKQAGPRCWNRCALSGHTEAKSQKGRCQELETAVERPWLHAGCCPCGVGDVNRCCCVEEDARCALMGVEAHALCGRCGTMTTRWLTWCAVRDYTARWGRTASVSWRCVPQ